MMTKGQVFYADYAKPICFCDEAWNAIYQYVIARPAPAAICSIMGLGQDARRRHMQLHDGLSTVIFKLEATGQTSHMDYEPVR